MQIKSKMKEILVTFEVQMNVQEEIDEIRSIGCL